MTAWDIKPYGVKNVINRTVGAFKPVEAHVKTFVTSSRDATEATGSPRVAQALQGFVQHHQPTLTGIARRTNRTLQAAADATMAYVHGDEQMAAQTPGRR
ncbi:hypothetical protein BZB76_3253 [Actinomadura pelletieri DSM 43383]|uniref:Excreted virulence factor EspC (Type VII ESX diderm) n=1 Tax=Actinomadura pelletieri DSM 43383 TaxID=1120940 RepID=A0A495QP40_9ACTN|nr:DUF6507 family protein [Actinomadura pelletieri]RKS74734.1 hypothetical protein BZB76_3253 [Actinomadura pelletieri DSM 43383]